MSVPVELDALRDEVARRGAVAYVVTVSSSGAPHVVSVTTSWDGDLLTAGAGSTTGANIGRAPGVTLMWPPVAGLGEGEGYCLIVDGQAEAVDGRLSVHPTRAVLHRLADTADGPSCVTLLPAGS